MWCDRNGVGEWGLNKPLDIQESVSMCAYPCLCVQLKHTGTRIGLTHWGWVTHICVSKSTIIGSDNGLSPGRRQAIIWTNAGILLIRPLGTDFNEMLIEILTFSFMKMCLKVSSAKWRPFCIGLNVLRCLMWCVPYYDPAEFGVTNYDIKMFDSPTKRYNF